MKFSNLIYKALLLFVLIFSCQNAFAAIYKCKQGNGKFEYQSMACKNGEEISNQLKNTKYSECTDNEGKSCISMAFPKPDMQIRTALQILADFSGNKLEADDSIQGASAFVYARRPWEQIMRDIASRFNLNIKIENGTIFAKAK
jgi:hypothetical protein